MSDDPALVTIARYGNPVEANLAKGLLERTAYGASSRTSTACRCRTRFTRWCGAGSVCRWARRTPKRRGSCSRASRPKTSPRRARARRRATCRAAPGAARPTCARAGRRSWFAVMTVLLLASRSSSAAASWNATSATTGGGWCSEGRDRMMPRACGLGYNRPTPDGVVAE